MPLVSDGRGGVGPVAYSRTLIGPQEIIASESLRREQERRDAWPYAYTFGPPNSIRRDPMGFIVAPNTGALNQAEVLLFSVPSGFDFVMTDLLIGVFGANQVPVNAPGDFTFSVDKNSPINVSAVQGGPIADWNMIPFNLGSLIFGPWKLPRAELFAPGDDIRAKVINNSGGVGAGTFICAMFGGWLLPTDRKRGK